MILSGLQQPTYRYWACCAGIRSPPSWCQPQAFSGMSSMCKSSIFRRHELIFPGTIEIKWRCTWLSGGTSMAHSPTPRHSILSSSRVEACQPIATDALRLALTPTLNQMRCEAEEGLLYSGRLTNATYSVIGLISIPGKSPQHLKLIGY